MANRQYQLKNKQLIGNMPLYFVEHVGAKNLEKQCYILDRMLLIKIMRGTATVEINEKKYDLTSRNFVFLPPQSIVRIIKSSYDLQVQVNGFMMAVQDIVLQKLGHSFFMYVFKQLVWTLSEDGEISVNAFCKLYEDACNMPQDMVTTDIINSLVNFFLLALYQKVRDRLESNMSMPANSKNLAAKFAILLRENYKHEHAVSFYAGKLCISPKYLTQVLKENTGLTPKSAIDRTLGAEAMFMLTNSSLNVQEISNELGFPDQSYFGRFFKRLFGVSPLHYRLNPDMTLLNRLAMIKVNPNVVE